MSTCKNLSQISVFIKNQIKVLLSTFQNSKNVSLALGLYNQTLYGEELFSVFKPDFSVSAMPETFIEQKVQHYLNCSRDLVSVSLFNETMPTDYEIFATMYVFHAEACFQLQFMKALKRDGDIQEFTYTEGRIHHKYPFSDIRFDWEEGVTNLIASVKEAISVTESFIASKCGAAIAA